MAPSRADSIFPPDNGKSYLGESASDNARGGLASGRAGLWATIPRSSFKVGADKGRKKRACVVSRARWHATRDGVSRTRVKLSLCRDATRRHRGVHSAPYARADRGARRTNRTARSCSLIGRIKRTRARITTPAESNVAKLCASRSGGEESARARARNKGACAESNAVKLCASRSGKRKAAEEMWNALARGENSTRRLLDEKGVTPIERIWPQPSDEICGKDARSAAVRGRRASRQIALSALRKYIVQRTERDLNER